jgi:hypothetical protein
MHIDTEAVGCLSTVYTASPTTPVPVARRLIVILTPRDRFLNSISKLVVSVSDFEQ